MITAELFWNTFATELHAACLNDRHWISYIDHSKEWTNFVIPVIHLVGEKLGFDSQNEIQHEFYKIDVIYYRQHQNIPADFPTPPHSNWDLEVIVEHENSWKHWLWNITKLCHINCGLKVIIAYHDYKDSHGTLEQKLSYMKELYDLRCYKQKPDNWLLLLGPNTQSLCKSGKDFVAYQFNGTEFNLLEDKIIFRQAI